MKLRQAKQKAKKVAKAALQKEKELQKKAQLHLGNAKKRFVAAEKNVKRYAKKNPAKAAAIAAGIGAAIGAALAFALRKKK